MSDPKNEESPEQTSTTPSVGTPDESTENEPALEPAEQVSEEAEQVSEEPEEPTTDAASSDEDTSSDEPEQAADENVATDETVALPVAEPETAESRPDPESEPASDATSAADAPTVQIPVRSHVPKAPPQRIAPRGEEPTVQPEPVRVAVQPTPTRIPPARDKSRGRRLIVAGAAAVLVVVAIVAAGVIVFLKDRADNSPESRIRSSIDTFVGALESGDLTTLRESTCGALSDFYETVDPENFRDIHRLAVEQGEIPVVTSVDRIQITEGTAIAQVTAHTVNDPGDVTDRTFDLTLDGEQWKVCSE
ncbi:hypothetical protein ACNJ7K_26480 [Rhodococcus aetherivorans]